MKPASGQKIRLIYGHYRHKAGIANDQQTVLLIFAVSGALWRSSRSLLYAAGWCICQLRCPALRKDLSQSEDKERLYFRIE